MKKNILYAGLFNMLLPGSSYLYVDDDRGRFGTTLVGGIIAVTVAILLGTAIQGVKDFFLPQGILPALFAMAVFAVLFRAGRNLARWHNNGIDRSSIYDGYRRDSAGTAKAQALHLRREHDAKVDQESGKDLAEPER